MSINVGGGELRELKPRILVIGVGGAGCNAVNTMINANVLNVDFMVANTDGQALSRSLTKKQIHPLASPLCSFTNYRSD